MSRGPSPIERVTHTLREFLTARELEPVSAIPLVVACSGGADSLALAAAAMRLARQRHSPVQTGQLHVLVVDHGLQAESAEIAQRAIAQVKELGYERAEVRAVHVTGSGGLEAAARTARYAALLADSPANALILLGHTLDDQAETVLLGLGRGSGPRSIQGMPALAWPWGRPLLGISRATTAAACAEWGLHPWQDPHNADPRFTRARLRAEAMPLLEDILQSGVRESLARTATQLREDAEVLDALADQVRNHAEVELPGGEHARYLDVHELAKHPAALRRRVLRSWLLAGGVPELSDAHLRQADALIGQWCGQGGPALPGGFVLHRRHGRLLLEPR